MEAQRYDAWPQGLNQLKIIFKNSLQYKSDTLQFSLKIYNMENFPH